MRRQANQGAENDTPAAEADTDDRGGGLELSPSATAAAVADTSDREADTNPSRPTPRSPTETLVMDFLVTLLVAVAAQIQPPSKRPVCIANAFEQTFRLKTAI